MKQQRKTLRSSSSSSSSSRVSIFVPYKKTVKQVQQETDKEKVINLKHKQNKTRFLSFL
jgi:hypothetical protein